MHGFNFHLYKFSVFNVGLLTVRFIEESVFVREKSHSPDRIAVLFEKML